MNTQQIAAYFINEPQFKGVFAADTIPFHITSGGIIVNTDKKNEPGEHWVAIYYNGDGSCEYWDGFGLPPIVPEIIWHITQTAPEGCYFNSRPVQSLTSVSCGQYCIAYLTYKFQGKSMFDFVSQFCKHAGHNENKITNIYRRLFNKH